VIRAVGSPAEGAALGEAKEDDAEDDDRLAKYAAVVGALKFLPRRIFAWSH
jgi:hypothetical protein